MGLGLTLARETARLHGGDLVYDATRGFVTRLPPAI
jgi:signal transduction histidine kinase